MSGGWERCSAVRVLSSAEKQTLVAVVEQVAVVDGGARVSGAHGRRTIAITEADVADCSLAPCVPVPEPAREPVEVGACGRALAASRATRGVKVESATISASRAASLCPAERGRRAGARSSTVRDADVDGGAAAAATAGVLLACCLLQSSHAPASSGACGVIARV